MYMVDGRTAQISIAILGDCYVQSSGRFINPPFNLLRILAYVLLEGNGKPVLRRRIGEEVDLRSVPEIIFRYDLSTDSAMRIEEILNSLPELHKEP